MCINMYSICKRKIGTRRMPVLVLFWPTFLHLEYFVGHYWKWMKFVCTWICIGKKKYKNVKARVCPCTCMSVCALLKCLPFPILCWVLLYTSPVRVRVWSVVVFVVPFFTASVYVYIEYENKKKKTKKTYKGANTCFSVCVCVCTSHTCTDMYMTNPRDFVYLFLPHSLFNKCFLGFVLCVCVYACICRYSVALRRCIEIEG